MMKSTPKIMYFYFCCIFYHEGNRFFSPLWLIFDSTLECLSIEKKIIVYIIDLNSRNSFKTFLHYCYCSFAFLLCCCHCFMPIMYILMFLGLIHLLCNTEEFLSVLFDNEKCSFMNEKQKVCSFRIKKEGLRRKLTGGNCGGLMARHELFYTACTEIDI